MLIILFPETGELSLLDFDGKLITNTRIKKNDNKWIPSFCINPKNLSCLTSNQGMIELWGLKGHQVNQPLRSHTGRIHSIAFSFDGQHIASVGQTIYSDSERIEDKTVRLWNLSGTLINTLDHDCSVSAVAFNQDSKLIASFDGSLWLRNTNGEVIGKLPNLVEGIEIREAAIAFGQNDQEIIVTTASQGEAMIFAWNRQNNSVRKSSYTQSQSQIVLTISPDTQTILLGGQGAQVINYNADVITQLKGGHRERYKQIMAVAFSTDSKLIVTGSYDQSVQLWNYEGTLIGSAFTGHQNVVSAVAFSPDGNYIASGDWNGVIRLWDLQGNPVGEFQGHESEINALTFSPDGYTLVSGGNDGSLRLWRAHWKCWLELACDRLRYHPVFTDPESIADPEQRKIAITACETCKKYVWHREDETD
jgi:WD40 repeat protein